MSQSGPNQKFRVLNPSIAHGVSDRLHQNIRATSKQNKFKSERARDSCDINKVLDSHASGDIYRCMHHLSTFVAFRKWRIKFFKCKKGDNLSEVLI